MENNKEKKSVIDKFILGALIGGAIGSVLGLSLAPKSGKETRKSIYKGIKKLFLSKRERAGLKEIPHENIKEKTGINK